MDEITLIEELYNMKLHDTIDTGVYDILRVPGGWLYTLFGDKTTTTTFIPFNNEFLNINNKQIIT